MLLRVVLDGFRLSSLVTDANLLCCGEQLKFVRKGKVRPNQPLTPLISDNRLGIFCKESVYTQEVSSVEFALFRVQRSRILGTCLGGPAAQNVESGHRDLCDLKRHKQR